MAEAEPFSYWLVDNVGKSSNREQRRDGLIREGAELAGGCNSERELNAEGTMKTSMGA